ncbi:MAG: outer membrane protein assembly factor BamB family protein [Planctomycetota bacterium]
MAIAGITLLLLATAGQAQWQVGVGGVPARNGLSAQNGPGAADLLWQTTQGTTVAQQAVIDGDLVVVNRLFDLGDPLHGTFIEGHDLHTGAKLWSVEIPDSFPDSWRSRVTGIRDGQVYATRSGNTNAEYLYALSPVDGSILWTSDDLITETSTESVAFTPDGDIVTSGVASAGARLIRIDKDTGDTVWTVPGTCPTSGGCDAAIFGNRAYMWEASPSGPKITAVDLATGAKLYSGDGIVGGFIQQVAPFVGPDGTVYAPRTQNNPVTDFLVAYDDTGSALVERWRRPIGYCPFASFGVGPDGSVYSYSAAKEIERLDPATGALRGLSAPIGGDFFQPRMAIDVDGTIYLTNGAFTGGALLAYTPNLTQMFSVAIPSVNVAGPALGADGTLIVGGTGATLRAYRCDAEFLAYGEGCAGSGGSVPSLAGGGCPEPGGSVTVFLDDALGGAAAFLLFGAGDGVATAKGCPLNVVPLLPLNIPLGLPGAGPGAGEIALGGSVPPGTPPLDLYLQVFVVDPGGPAGAAASNGLRMHVE